LMARGSMYQRGLGDIGYLAGRYLNQPAAAPVGDEIYGMYQNF